MGRNAEEDYEERRWLMLEESVQRMSAYIDTLERRVRELELNLGAASKFSLDLMRSTESMAAQQEAVNRNLAATIGNYRNLIDELQQDQADIRFLLEGQGDSLEWLERNAITRGNP